MDEGQIHPPSKSKETASEGRLKEIKRSYVACERCHRNKTKCNGQTPCRNCKQARKPIDCVYPVRDRKITVAESYIKQLEAENKSLKRKRSPERDSTEISNGANHDKEASIPTPQSLLQNGESFKPSLGRQTMGEETGGSSTDTNQRYVTDETLIQPRYSGEASSETFGSRLHQYINHGETRPPPRPYIYYKNPKLFRTSSTECNLPNKNYAKLLVRAVLRFVGGDHHLLLRKSFLQRLDETYELEVLDDPVWLCRLYTVFALGELYSPGRLGNTLEGTGVPGTGFFVKAMGFFQDLHEEPTISYLETLLLLSFYNVALNRRNTAYTYAGLAVRLGLTLGLHRKVPEDSGMSAPEREHRVRVWWTAYALDRIYTSKVGLPIMLRDSDIDVQMPSMDGLTPQEAEDFYPPELMTAQIQLARITGEIMSDLYKIPQPGKANTFVQSVQRILTSLRSWHETLPDVLRLDFNAMPIYPSRSVASLHLHFGNAVIQTTRPILFHLFRSHFGQSTDSSEAVAKTVSPMTTALGEACVQAARTSNSILAQLWVDGCLAPFGYFDSLSVFASTMILMMAEAMKESGGPENDAVETAWSLLRSMREAGNLPAVGYYDHLLELKADLDSLKSRHNSISVSVPLHRKDRDHNPSISSLSQASHTSPPHLLNTSPLQTHAQLHHNQIYISNPQSRIPNFNIPTPAFGIGETNSALDGQLIQQFLQQSYPVYGDWNTGSGATFDTEGSGVVGSGHGGSALGGVGGQFQFDWENANLFGSG